MRSLVVCAGIVVLALAGPTRAVVIMQVEPDGSLAQADATVTDAGDHIEVDLVKEFKAPEMMGAPLVLQFTLETGDVGKDIWLVHEGGLGDVGEEVTNLTGEAWADYHMVLVNLDPASQPPLPPCAAAAFTDLAGVSSDMLDVVATAAEQIDFANGTVPHGGVVHFSNVHIAHNGVADAAFYLKQIPTPEPGTLVLLLAPALVAMRRRR